MIELRQAAFDLRFVVPVAVAWVVALLLVGDPAPAWWVAVVAGGLAVCGVVARAVLVGRAALAARVVGGLVVVTGAATALVAVAVAVGQPLRVPDAVLAFDGRSVDVEAVVSRDVEPTAKSFPATLHALSQSSPAGTAGSGARTAGDGRSVAGLTVPIRIIPARSDASSTSAREDAFARGIPAGSHVTVRGVLQREPDGGAAAFVVFARAGGHVTAGPSGILATTDAARSAFAAVTERLPEPGAGLLRGLAIGDRAGLDPDVDEAMRTTSLTHLTAVSGSNCAVLVALVMVVGRALRAPRWIRVTVALVVLAGFVVLVRPDPSIVRATIMAVVVLLVHLIGRPVTGTPLLALAALGMLVVDPWTARSFAFALSVLATGGILVVAPVLTERMTPRIGALAATVVAVPIAAQVACWPVTVLLAPVVPTYSVLANLLAEPLAPVATVVGLAACVLAPLWPSGALVAAAVAWVPSTLIAVLAEWSANLPGASIPWPEGGPGALLAGIACLGIVVAALTPRARARLVALLVAGGVGTVAVGGIVVPVMLTRGSLPTDWGIAACDIGQGDAVVVRDESSVALVDTGDDERALLRCLDLLGVDRIDLFVASHHDRDHIGAVPAIADRVDVALVGPEGRAVDARTATFLRAGGADVRDGRSGASGRLGRLAWELSWPPASMTTAGNDASLVVTFRPTADCAGCLSSTFLGDLGARAQQRYRSAADPQPVDVVKVAHHGSSDQDPALYTTLDAAVGIVSVGADNSYGHPTQFALSMLRAAGTRAVRTDLGGTIALSGDPGEAGAVRVWEEHGARDDGAEDGARDEGARDDGAGDAGARDVGVRSYTRSQTGTGIGAESSRTTRTTRRASSGRQKAVAGIRRDRSGAVVGDPSGARDPRHRARDVPRRTRHRDDPRHPRGRGPGARGP